ncbi:MAG: hypothetical protein ACE5FD_13670 [Anaerolineae bacterium]
MESNESIPIACLLPDETFVKRREEVKTAVFTQLQNSVELADGYAFQFSGTDEWANNLLEFVLFERQCCPFLTFELQFDADRGAIWLRIRGGDEVKAFIQSELHSLAG